MCKAHIPAMNFKTIACGAPKGTNIKTALAETQGYDRLFARRVDHSFWYNKHMLPEGFFDTEEDEEDEDAEEDSGDASAYVASEDEDHVSE
jgi:hypothetical protein